MSAFAPGPYRAVEATIQSADHGLWTTQARTVIGPKGTYGSAIAFAAHLVKCANEHEGLQRTLEEALTDALEWKRRARLAEAALRIVREGLVRP